MFLIGNAINKRTIRSAAAKRESTPSPTPNISLDDLEKLAGLRDKGIISPAEFEAKKKEILGL